MQPPAVGTVPFQAMFSLVCGGLFVYLFVKGITQKLLNGFSRTLVGELDTGQENRIMAPIQPTERIQSFHISFFNTAWYSFIIIFLILQGK